MSAAPGDRRGDGRGQFVNGGLLDAVSRIRVEQLGHIGAGAERDVSGRGARVDVREQQPILLVRNGRPGFPTGDGTSHAGLLRGRDPVDAQPPRGFPQRSGESGPRHATRDTQSLQRRGCVVPADSHSRSTPLTSQTGSTIRGLSSFAA